MVQRLILIGPRPKEISHRARRCFQLVQAGDRNQRVAVRVAAQMGHVSSVHLGGRHIQRADICDIIVGGIVAVEKIEEFCERNDRPAITNPYRASKAARDPAFVAKVEGLGLLARYEGPAAARKRLEVEYADIVALNHALQR